MDWAKTTAKRDEKHLGFWIWGLLYWRSDGQGWGTRTRYSYTQYSSTEFLVLVLVRTKVIVLVLVLVLLDKYSGTGTSTDILWYISIFTETTYSYLKVSGSK